MFGLDGSFCGFIFIHYFKKFASHALAADVSPNPSLLLQMTKHGVTHRCYPTFNIATRKRLKVVPYAGTHFGLLESMKIVWRAQELLCRMLVLVKRVTFLGGEELKKCPGKIFILTWAYLFFIDAFWKSATDGPPSRNHSQIRGVLDGKGLIENAKGFVDLQTDC